MAAYTAHSTHMKHIKFVGISSACDQSVSGQYILGLPFFQDNMLFCDACDRGFHMECCRPPVNRPPKGE